MQGDGGREGEAALAVEELYGMRRAMPLASGYRPVMVASSSGGVRVPEFLRQDLLIWRFSQMCLDRENRFMYIAQRDGCIKEYEVFPKCDVSSREDFSTPQRLNRVLRSAAGETINNMLCETFEGIGRVIFLACGEVNSSRGSVICIFIDIEDPHTNSPRKEVMYMPDSAWGLAAHPGSNKFASSCNAHEVKLFQISRRLGAFIATPFEIFESLVGHAGNIPCISFSPGGRFLVSCSIDGTMRLWNVRTAEQVGCYPSAVQMPLMEADSEWGWFVQWVPKDSVKVIDDEDELFKKVRQTGMDRHGSYSNALRFFWRTFGQTLTCTPVFRENVTNFSLSDRDLEDAESVMSSFEVERSVVSQPTSHGGETTLNHLNDDSCHRLHPVHEPTGRLQLSMDIEEASSGDEADILLVDVGAGSEQESEDGDGDDHTMAKDTEEAHWPRMEPRGQSSVKGGGISKPFETIGDDMVLFAKKDSISLVRLPDMKKLAELNPIVPESMLASGAFTRQSHERICMAKYISELSLVVACLQGCGVVILARIVRLPRKPVESDDNSGDSISTMENEHQSDDEEEHFTFITESLLSRGPRPYQSIVGFWLSRVNADHPALDEFELYILRDSGYLDHFRLSRRSSSLPVDLAATTI